MKGRARRRLWPSAAGLLGIAALLGAALVFWPYLTGSTVYTRYMGRQSATLQNAKALSVALLQYVGEHDGRFPDSFASSDDLAAAVGSRSTGRAVATYNPNGGMFVPNGNLAGRDASDMAAPGQVVLLFDSREWPDGRRACGYADGRVGWVLGTPDLSVGPPATR